MSKEEITDLVATTAYIYKDILNERFTFFDYIDKVQKIAEEFIKIYPTGTDWEARARENDNTGLTWEETLYQYVKDKHPMLVH